jgi:hypothetical protein
LEVSNIDESDARIVYWAAVYGDMDTIVIAIEHKNMSPF